MSTIVLANSQIALSSKLFACVLLLGSFNIVTANPINLPDSMFTSYSAGGSTMGNGTAGIVAGSFSSSGAETGTSSGQGGLGTTNPYPVSDWGTLKDRVVQLRNSDGDKVGAAEIDSTITGDDANAPVFGFLAYRSDASSNQKWRIHLYYVASDGTYTYMDPDTTPSGIQLYGVNVATLANLNPASFLGIAEVGQDLASLVIGAGAITESMLANGAVTNAKIGADAVDVGKLANDAVETAKIKYLNVTTAKIAPDAITVAKLASDAVETAKIKDANVTTAKIADDAITLAKFGARPEAEETTLTSATTWDLAHGIDADHVKGVQIDINGQKLHYGSASDVSHFQVNGSGGTGSVARVTFGAAVSGYAQATYLY